MSDTPINLDDLRQRIDQLDGDILRLISERASCAQQVAPPPQRRFTGEFWYTLLVGEPILPQNANSRISKGVLRNLYGAAFCRNTPYPEKFIQTYDFWH